MVWRICYNPFKHKREGRKVVSKLGLRKALRYRAQQSDSIKVVKIRHHHAKPYRKRHYGLLIFSIVAALLIIVFSWQYYTFTSKQTRSARNFISYIFGSGRVGQNASTINSAYGFSLSYDQSKFYASAIDGATGNLYLGDELLTQRPYNTIRISPSGAGATKTQSTISLQYYNTNTKAGSDLIAIETSLVQGPEQAKTAAVTKLSTTKLALDGQQFIKTTWKRQPKSTLSSTFATTFVSYVGIINGRPLVIKVDNGLLEAGSSDWSVPIIESIKFGSAKTKAFLPSDSKIAANTAASLSLLDRFTFTGLAQAAAQSVSSSEKSSALYSPAVVKIYNVYCMDISIDNQPFLADACSAASGSGFFIGSNGYIGTNGHVASAKPKDIAITYGLQTLDQGDETYFDFLAGKANLTPADFNQDQTAVDRLAQAVDKMYQIPDSSFTETNSVINLLVGLGQKQPNVDELLNLTQNRQQYTEQDSIKRAELSALDYRAIDGITSYKNSDVAIIKVNGSNYPVVKIGNIDSISQGSQLSILGFPGSASDNGLVDSSQSKATLTTGTASSIKNANGSSKKLIETTTTIGHGNSGGPVLNKEGQVVGIATYTVDGSGQGNGVFNYIRDIKDLTDLASLSVINLDATSSSQDTWAKAVDLFYSAHYSKSLKVFVQAKQLYPNNPRVDEFVASAQQRIKDGEDIKDFPVIPVAAGSLTALVAIAASIILIKRHKTAHKVYKAEVASGRMKPLTAKMPAQRVSYNPASLRGAKKHIHAKQP